MCRLHWIQVAIFVKILLGTSGQAAYGHDYSNTDASSGDNDTLKANQTALLDHEEEYVDGRY